MLITRRLRWNTHKSSLVSLEVTFKAQYIKLWEEDTRFRCSLQCSKWTRYSYCIKTNIIILMILLLRNLLRRFQNAIDEFLVIVCIYLSILGLFTMVRVQLLEDAYGDAKLPKRVVLCLFSTWYDVAEISLGNWVPPKGEHIRY